MPFPATESVPVNDFNSLQHRIAKLEKELKLQNALSTQDRTEDAMSMVVFSGELDRLLASFVIATGAAACGTKVSMFFTFWATAALKKEGKQAKGKSVMERMFGWMLPGGFNKQKLSKMDMCGLGRKMMLNEMQKKNVPSLEELIEIAGDLDVEINICEMSMSLMGIKEEELIDYPHKQFCGVAHFVEQSSRAQSSLFI
ncbi:CoA-disulfide reductase / Disulfide bond regulator [hydrothermal vent metagenome]|uniref:CoA-disulfide reductase / Disulfide bond regulator n=1 Tax=hydrothermal vent metagenome TaxID=652676 RepID=A0A3B1E795_9ZZZZ